MKPKFVGKHSEITDKILEAFFAVYNELGYGFLEKVYENAMSIELSKMGLQVEHQKAVRAFYKGQCIGEFFVDLEVEKVVIVELKAAQQLVEEHNAQLTNYLRSSDIEVVLLLNFGHKPEFRRKVFDNDRKIQIISETQ